MTNKLKIYIICSLLYAFIFGVLLGYFLKQNLNQKVTSNTQNIVPTIIPTPTTLVIQPTNTDKIIFTAEVQQQLNYDNKICELRDNFNSDPKKSELITYSDSEISFKMPYSTAWGNEKYLLQPYEDHTDELSQTKLIKFGRLVLGVEGCGGGRSFSLTITPKQPLSEIATLVKNQYAQNIRTETINGIPVLFYDEDPGILSTSYAVITGIDHTYYLTSFFDDIMPIIKTFKLK